MNPLQVFPGPKLPSTTLSKPPLILLYCSCCKCCKPFHLILLEEKYEQDSCQVQTLKQLKDRSLVLFLAPSLRLFWSLSAKAPVSTHTQRVQMRKQRRLCCIKVPHTFSADLCCSQECPSEKATITEKMRGYHLSLHLHCPKLDTTTQQQKPALLHGSFLTTPLPGYF